MSLQEKAYRGVGWSGLSGIIANGLELSKYIVLARILEPADFGLLAMAMVIVGICRIFADGGTSNAVIHFRNQTGPQLSTLFWINILAGLSLYLLVFLSAPFFAAFYSEPEVTPLMRLGGLVLPLYAAGVLYEVKLRKSLSFRMITITESTSALFSFITALVLALWGWGVYALIWSHIVTAGTMALLYAANGMRHWKPSFVFRPRDVVSHLRFGFFQMGERGLNVYATRIDQLIIGRFFGPEILGAYHIAWQIVLFPVMRLSPLLNRVALPVFANRQDDDGILRNGYLRLMSGVTALVTPFLLILAVSSPWLIPLLFGSGWNLTIQLVPLMAVLAFFRMLGSPSNNIVLSKGKAALAFYWALLLAILNTGIFLIGAQFSIYVLLGLHTIGNALYFIVGQRIMVNRLIDLTWIRFLSHLTPFLAALLIPWCGSWVLRNLASGVWPLSHLLDGKLGLTEATEALLHAWQNVTIWYQHAVWGDAGMVIAIVTLFLILYLPVLWYFQSGLIREFMQALRPSGRS